MADEDETHNNNTMNLDLNLRPGSLLPSEDDPIEVDDWSDDDGLGEAVRRTSIQRWRWLQFENHSIDLSQLLDSVGVQRPVGGGLDMGEGSVAGEERVPEVEKVCENKVIVVDDEAVGGDDEDGKGGGDNGSFYDCNICFELAKDPVITCCGHLYCWPCIYQWIHVHSDTNECPVCKGEVTIKSVIPIYGRGDSKQLPEEDLTIKIPPRPVAKRVESRQMTTFAIPVEEMIRRLGSRFDLTRDISASQYAENAVIVPDRSYSHLLNRIMTTRAVRREQNLSPSENVVDLTQSVTASPEELELIEPDTRLARRFARNRVRDTRIPSFTPAMSASDRLIETYMQSHPIVTRRSGQSSPVDDRNSFSSIAAVMNSGSQSQTVDTAAEIDSLVSLSTSSSRRRTEAARTSDVDSGDSRLPRRRRLN